MDSAVGQNIKQKLKHFRWKCLKRIVPINEAFRRRTGIGDPMCKVCGTQVEKLEHIMFFCGNAKEIWRRAPISWDGLECFRENFWLWWEELMQTTRRAEGKEHIALTVNILWQIWKSRMKNSSRTVERVQ